MTDISHISSKEFYIENGLQQGTLNSPLRFSIYNSDLLNLFNLNTSTHKRSIAFAGDLIIYMTDRKTKSIRTELQESFNKISDYYYIWKLKINGSKCETILFRSKTSKIGPIERERCKKFQLKEKANEGELIPHKNCVKYLGVNIDDKLNYKQHIEIQLSKVSKAFWKTKKLFYSMLRRVKRSARRTLMSDRPDPNVIREPSIKLRPTINRFSLAYKNLESCKHFRFIAKYINI